MQCLKRASGTRAVQAFVVRQLGTRYYLDTQTITYRLLWQHSPAAVSPVAQTNIIWQFRTVSVTTVPNRDTLSHCSYFVATVSSSRVTRKVSAYVRLRRRLIEQLTSLFAANSSPSVRQ